MLALWFSALAAIPLLLVCCCTGGGETLSCDPALPGSDTRSAQDDNDDDEEAALLRALAAPNPLDPFGLPGPAFGFLGLEPEVLQRYARPRQWDGAEATLKAVYAVLDAAAARYEEAAGTAGGGEGRQDLEECGVCLARLASSSAAHDCSCGGTYVAEGGKSATAAQGCVRLCCGHDFHRSCATRWLVHCDGRVCPMCRIPVLPLNEPETNSTE